MLPVYRRFYVIFVSVVFMLAARVRLLIFFQVVFGACRVKGVVAASVVKSHRKNPTAVCSLARRLLPRLKRRGGLVLMCSRLDGTFRREPRTFREG